MLNIIKDSYPPSYKPEIYHYEKANADHVRKTTEQFSWDSKMVFYSIELSKIFFQNTFLIELLEVTTKVNLR